MKDNPSFLWKNCVFETMKVENKRIFLLDEHLSRLHKSASRYNIHIPKKNILLDSIDELTKQHPSIPYFRITAQKSNVNPTRARIHYSINTTSKYTPSDYEKGINVTFVDNPIKIEPSLAGIKGDFLHRNIKDREKVIARGYKEGIYLTEKGYIAEGCVSNIFWIKDNTVFTPSSENCILAGITRSFVINLLNKHNIKIIEGDFDRVVLSNADEIFLTNSLMDILPVTQVNDNAIHNLSVGKMTKRIIKLFAESRSEFLT